MQSPSTKNRVIAPMLIGITLILGVAFLKPAYSTYIEQEAFLSTLEKEKTTTKGELDELIKIRDASSASMTPEQKIRIEKLAKKFDTSDIMSSVLLNDFTKPSNGKDAIIGISSISVNKGIKLPSGLSLGNVSLSFKAETVSDIIKFITFLTQNSEYLFTIDSITLPIDTDPESELVRNLSMSISLGVYYFE